MAGSVVGSPTSPRTRPRSNTPSIAVDPPPPLRCCCGSLLCDVLRHNCSVLESVENDVQMAARLGQALLIRHEALMAQSDRDAARSAARIRDLESDNDRLEAANADTAARNRGLERDLAALNIRVAESDARVRELEADLEASREAARRFEVQTGELDRHIVAVEEEVVRLQASLVGEREEGRGAVRRWRVAERRINDLQDELDRMEAGAREERERQAEIIDRMEAQRAVERELSCAAGRLKGAAAAKSLGLGLGPDQEGGGSKVVSRFVRDLLQDNAGLQVAVAELRELLASSSDEIQTLRDRLAQHQPAQREEVPDAGPGATLQVELGTEVSPPPSREVHIHHHHYHMPPRHEPKKPKKRRHPTFPMALPAPDSPRHASMRARWEARMPAVASPSSEFFSARASAADSDAEWPVPSGGADEDADGPSSSVSSSPASNARNSMFDRGLADPSSPVSPTTSVDPLSPAMRATGGKHLSMASMGSALGAALESSRGSVGGQPEKQVPAVHVTDTVEESPHERRHDEGVEDGMPTHTTTRPRPEIALSGDASTSPPDTDPLTPLRPLRRTVSHESVMSLAGGLDIHTLKSRPSQLTLCRHAGAQAIVTGINAQPTITCVSPGGMGASVLMGSLASSVSASSSSGRGGGGGGGGGGGAENLRAVSGPLQGLGGIKWKGWKPWGRSLSPGVAGHESGGEGGADEGGGDSGTPDTLRAGQQQQVEAAQHQRAEVSPSPTESRGRGKVRDVLRAPGINQPGAIPGFQEYLASARRRGPPSRVRAENVDREALRDIFED